MAFATETPTQAPSPFLPIDQTHLLTNTERLGFAGLPGAGKTHAALTLFDAIATKYKLPPEKTTVYVLDCDNGMAKLIRRGLIPEAYRSSIRYALAHNWSTCTTAMDTILKEGPELLRKNGPGSTWLIVDNVYKTYRWCRDQYSLDVFGMTEVERAKQQRRKALTNPENKRGVLPTFDQEIDYGSITPMYLGNFWDPIMFSGINLLITMPTYEKWKTGKDGAAPTLVEMDLRCQSQVAHDLDDIVWFRTPADNVDLHLATYYKRRSASKSFKDIPDLTVSRLLNFFEKYPNEEAAKPVTTATVTA